MGSVMNEPPRSPANGGHVLPVVRDARATSVEIRCPPGEADTQWQFDVVSGHDQDLGILTQLRAISGAPSSVSLSAHPASFPPFPGADPKYSL